MRKLLIIFALIVAFIGVSVAQDFTVYRPGITALIPLDTITNTGTDNQSALLKLQTGKAWGLSCQVTIEALTGTHDIDLEFQSSNDGTNWVNVATTTLATTTLSYLHEDISGFSGRYFRVVYTGGAGATQTTSVIGDLYVFRVPN